jgi:hypothetical protein
MVPQQHLNPIKWLWSRIVTSLPAFSIRVIHCEARIEIYTVFKLFGSEE